MTAEELIATSILRWKDSGQNSVVNQECLDYLNKGLKSVFMLLIREQSEIAITEADISLVADTPEYALETYLPSFHAMARDGVYFDDTSTPLHPVPFSDKIRNAGGAAAAPDSYYVTSSKIGFLPVPEAAKTAHCRYFKAITDLELTTEMPYGGIFNPALAFFADAVALLRKEAGGADFAAISNTLEGQALEIIRSRTPVGVV